MLIFFFVLYHQQKIQAISPNVYYQPGIYGNKVIGKLTYYGQLGLPYLDNKLVYCLEPNKLIGDNYSINNNFLNNFSKDDQKYFSLISYYGYNDTNRNNIYYYMAAQELIWERITKQDVYWTNQNVTRGDRYNIENYKNEILNNIYNHEKKPSFNNKYIEGNFREVISLVDDNNILNDYNIQNNTNNIVWKENNNLYIKIMSSKEEKINFTKNINTGNTTTYISDGNQSLAYLSLNEQITSNISIKAKNKYSMKLKINFKDSQTSDFIKDEVKFKIKKDNKYLNNNIYKSNEGEFISDFYLEEGNYEIETIDVPNGFLLNNNIKFNIIEDISTEVKEVDSYLDKVKGNINITRTFEYMNSKLKIKNIEYIIYAKENICENNKLIYKKNEFVEKIKTNDLGQAIIDNIPLGKYYIKENNNIENVITYKENYDIDLKYVDNKTKLVVENIFINTKTEDSTIDIQTVENKYICEEDKCKKETQFLNNIEYGIYAKENIYIDDILIIKKDSLILKVTTNNEGKISKKIQLLNGNYYIKEITNFSCYENKFEPYEFIVKNKIKINLNIEKIKREKIILQKLESLPETSNIYHKKNIIFVIITIVGVILYAETKKS